MTETRVVTRDAFVTACDTAHNIPVTTRLLRPASLPLVSSCPALYGLPVYLPPFFSPCIIYVCVCTCVFISACVDVCARLSLSLSSPYEIDSLSIIRQNGTSLIWKLVPKTRHSAIVSASPIRQGLVMTNQGK